ncbi:MAG: type II secretion system protein [Planctomycetota bacterium]|jgi:prepilin-type N-terminal cleavage/methylation domain-containing protein
MKQKYRNVFTLVELLVVIAIISVLAGMLLPALENAIGSARKASCMSNLRQMGQVLHSYSNDFNRFPIYPLGGGGSGNNAGLRYIREDAYDAMVGSHGLTDGLLLCPANELGTTVAHYNNSYGRIVGTSYLNLTGGEDTSIGVPVNSPRTPMDNNCIMMADMLYYINSKNKTITNHLIETNLPEGANVLYVDTSVRWNMWSPAWFTSPVITPDPDYSVSGDSWYYWGDTMLSTLP